VLRSARHRLGTGGAGRGGGRERARRLSGLEVAARALEADDLAKATVATVLMKLPPLSAEAMAKLARDPTLKKYSPDQPRDERGRWTSGDADGTADPGEDATQARPVQVAANDTGVMSDAGGILQPPRGDADVVVPPPPGTGTVREYSPADAAKLPPPPAGSKYVTLNDGSVIWDGYLNHGHGGPMLMPADVSAGGCVAGGQCQRRPEAQRLRA
jgi:hypothetical protein